MTRVLVRGLASRCPACGEGRVFVRGVQSARVCAVCGWRLERCLGHWVGGNEINALVTFTAGITVYVGAALAYGLGPVSVWIATVFTGAFGVAFYRPSRSLFFALDYLLDPDPDSESGPPPSDRGGGGPERNVPPPDPPRGPRGVARAPLPPHEPPARLPATAPHWPSPPSGVR